MTSNLEADPSKTFGVPRPPKSLETASSCTDSVAASWSVWKAIFYVGIWIERYTLENKSYFVRFIPHLLPIGLEMETLGDCHVPPIIWGWYSHPCLKIIVTHTSLKSGRKTPGLGTSRLLYTPQKSRNSHSFTFVQGIILSSLQSPYHEACDSIICAEYWEKEYKTRHRLSC